MEFILRVFHHFIKGEEDMPLKTEVLTKLEEVKQSFTEEQQALNLELQVLREKLISIDVTVEQIFELAKQNQGDISEGFAAQILEGLTTLSEEIKSGIETSKGLVSEAAAVAEQITDDDPAIP
jgi:regulator of replication initiation timing